MAGTIEGFFDAAEQNGYQDVPHSRAEWIEKDHGRIETRRCIVTDDLSCLKNPHDWPGVKTLVMVEATREIAGNNSTERR